MQMTINDELNEIRGGYEDYIVERGGYDVHNVNETAAAHAQHDRINDHSAMLRGSDGSVHAEYQDDTMVTINGVEMEYKTALQIGLIGTEGNTNDQGYDPEEAADAERATATVESLDPRIASQNSFAVNLIGEDAFMQALVGDKEITADLANQAGVTFGETLTMLENSVDEIISTGLTTAQELLGDRYDNDHFYDYLMSSRVSQSERIEIMASIRQQNVSGIFNLVERYRSHYNM